MPNRLALARSPYLRQHQDNPVDWYPWGPEALQRAVDEDRPILLSVGYSACHWCHVMEAESFSDPATAALMNGHFVNIKVDREERPDLDQIYQAVVQATRGRGGWPLTVFLTPERAAFFAGTYFPEAPRHGMPAFKSVLEAAASAFSTRRGEVESTAAELNRAVCQLTSAARESGPLPVGAVAEVAPRILARLDPVHGGFGRRMKFPNTVALDVLLRAHRRGVPGALEGAEHALLAMRDGGVNDQLGGGFHRYSTDARWLVPHFEKMLYDNALLARLYVDAFRITRDPRWEHTARSVLAYLTREMRSEDGLFFASQDADSEGAEGTFFVWTPSQLAEVLGPDDARIAASHFGVVPEGNFERSGSSVLHRAMSAAEVSAELGLDLTAVEGTLPRIRERLLEARGARPRPFRDHKVIASWNGLAIGAFAEAAAAFEDGSLAEVARRGLEAAARVLCPDGTLRRMAIDGTASGDAFLDDFAHLAQAALDVHRLTLDPAGLEFAEKLARGALDRFRDPIGGFFYAPDTADLWVRAHDTQDITVPGGASSLIRVLLELHGLSGDPAWIEPAREALLRTASEALEHPMAHGHLLGALDRIEHGPVAVVVTGDDGPAADALLRAARRAYVPDLVLIRQRGDAPAARGAAEAMPPIRPERVSAFVCQARTCSPAVHAPDALASLLNPAARHESQKSKNP